MMSVTTCVFCSMKDSAAIADDPDELLHQRIQPAVFGTDDVGHEADLAVGNNNFPPGPASDPSETGSSFFCGGGLAGGRFTRRIAVFVENTRKVSMSITRTNPLFAKGTRKRSTFFTRRIVVFAEKTRKVSSSITRINSLLAKNTRKNLISFTRTNPHFVNNTRNPLCFFTRKKGIYRKRTRNHDAG